MIVMNSKEHYSLAQEESDNDCDDQQRGLQLSTESESQYRPRIPHVQNVQIVRDNLNPKTFRAEGQHLPK